LAAFGNGPPVVILSNPLAHPDAWAESHVEALVEAGYQAITFVHSGFEHHYQAVVRDVVRFIRTLGLGAVHLLGWSNGAAIAQEVALAAPDLVVAAALVATYGRQNLVDVVLQDAWAELDRCEADVDSARLALLLLTGEPSHRLADDHYMVGRIAAMRRWATRPRNPENRQRSREFIDFYQGRLDALGSIRLPCLVLGFELDTDTFVERAREVANRIPDCKYVEIRDAGHLLPVTDPRLVIDPVVQFFVHSFPMTCACVGPLEWDYADPEPLPGSDDLLFGGPGDDTVTATAGDDFLSGGLGNDRMGNRSFWDWDDWSDEESLDHGADLYVGGQGDDLIETFDGVAGNDTVTREREPTAAPRTRATPSGAAKRI
jgi:pimeloyl-ACP methyl ester carboxylesterase